MGLSFRERIADRKCDLARSQGVSLELFHQFSACRPLDNNLNIVTSQCTPSHVENVLFTVSCVRAMSVRIAHLTVMLTRPSVAASVFSPTDCSV